MSTPAPAVTDHEVNRAVTIKVCIVERRVQRLTLGQIYAERTFAPEAASLFKATSICLQINPGPHVKAAIDQKRDDLADRDIGRCDHDIAFAIIVDITKTRAANSIERDTLIGLFSIAELAIGDLAEEVHFVKLVAIEDTACSVLNRNHI